VYGREGRKQGEDPPLLAIIWPCPLSPPSYAAAGHQIEAPAQACPGCNRALTGWGGYWRWMRAEHCPAERIWIRRGWCAQCRRTQALLPSFLFVRRLDADVVIGSALEQAAGGRGTRPIAQGLAVPHSTVRDWWRRVCARAPTLLALLLALATSLEPAPVFLTRDGLAGVLEALDSAWQRARRRLGAHIPDRWAFWSVVSGGLVLATHTSPPLSGWRGAG
jgi:hypothetical protein